MKSEEYEIEKKQHKTAKSKIVFKGIIYVSICLVIRVSVYGCRWFNDKDVIQKDNTYSYWLVLEITEQTLLPCIAHFT